MGRPRSGHIRERNGRYEVTIAKEHLGTAPDRPTAERWLAAALEQDAGIAPDAFSMFATIWIKDREIAARKRKRARSFKKELSVWNAHVATAKFFDWPTKRIQQPKPIQVWLHALAEKEAKDTIRRKVDGKWTTEYRPTGRTVGRRVLENALKLLKLCIDDAIIAGKLSAPNPARLVKLPREEVPEHDGELIVHLSKLEIKKLFALELPPLQRAVFAVAIYAGLRLDELWGLRWQDIIRLDGKRPELQVRRSYDGPCKTKTSIRDVPMLPPVVDALKAWRASLPTAPIAGLVFPGADGRCHSESYTAQWRDKPQTRGDEVVVTLGWAAKAGIRSEVDFRDLRHTCGCHLAQGTWTRAFTLHEIKRWMGHSSIAVTERHYAALTTDNLHNAVADREFTTRREDER